MSAPAVVIIGAGVAGLACGRRLAACGISFQIFEASDAVGGRVRTDVVDGFRLDRGFQVFLPAYPEARRVLDYDQLDLKPFARGVRVWFRGRFHDLTDPRLAPLTALRSFVSPVGTLRDRLRLPGFIRRIRSDDPAAGAEQPVLDLLRWAGGFSDSLIDRLFRPFLGGVSLDRRLAVSSRFGRFVLRTFAEGGAALPAAGMAAIPGQLAAGLPVRLGELVAVVGPGEVRLGSGEVVRTRAVVVATGGGTPLVPAELAPGSWKGSTTLYYAADRPPIGTPVLCLDGEGTGPVNSVAELSAVAPGYAPPGRSLVSAAVIGIPAGDDGELDRRVRGQLTGWFGPSVADWRLLRIDRIREALPDATAGVLDPWQRPVRVRPGFYVCGDHRDNPSIDGALTSGFRAAQAAREDLAAERC
jgi:phytoene dehydrogenase-like protein